MHGLVCTEVAQGAREVVSGNQLDVSLWQGASDAATAAARGWTAHRLAALRPHASVGQRPRRGAARFPIRDHEGRTRRSAGTLRAGRCGGNEDHARARTPTVHRVIAVAHRRVADEITRARRSRTGPRVRRVPGVHGPPKTEAAESLARLGRLGIAVKVITGDSAEVATKVCRDLGMTVTGALTGEQADAMSDDELGRAIAATTVFARTNPDTKARIVRVERDRGTDVAFLGDGVNDAVALHHADVGISVDTGTDVAKDAADIILLDKDLGVLADGVVEGRRIFANTIKYVLMATSSNFGNMFSAAVASIFLTFLPMLPTQILLNNLLYDISQMTIPTDNVDEEMLERPSALGHRASSDAS